MNLITVLLVGLVMAFTSAVLDYYQYEQMVAEYNQWAQDTGINNQ